jgi:hypothetical protein
VSIANDVTIAFTSARKRYAQILTRESPLPGDLTDLLGIVALLGIGPGDVNADCSGIAAHQRQMAALAAIEATLSQLETARNDALAFATVTENQQIQTMLKKGINPKSVRAPERETADKLWIEISPLRDMVKQAKAQIYEHGTRYPRVIVDGRLIGENDEQ